MIVIYGGSEKQQRRHLTMGFVRVGLWWWMFFFPFFFSFFLFFFIRFFGGSHHADKHAFGEGRRRVSFLICHGWYMPWTTPRTPTPALPSLPSPPPKGEMTQTKKATLTKRKEYEA